MTKSRNSTSVYRSWLLVAGFATMLSGVSISLLGLFPAGPDMLLTVAQISEKSNLGTRLFAGIAGALMAALGALTISAARAPMEVAPYAARSLAIAFSIWFVLDSGVSLLVAPLNVIINIFFVAMLGPPLVVLARSPRSAE